MKLIQCWIEHPVHVIDRLFTYSCTYPVVAGCRVKVEFGHKTLMGFVEKVEETNESLEEAETRLGMKIKPVQEVLDQESLITPELQEMAHWLHEETLSTMIACYQSMLPGKIKPGSHADRVVKEKWVSCAGTQAELTPKQKEAYDLVQHKGEMKYSELRKMYPGQAKILLTKGVLKITEKEREAGTGTRQGTDRRVPLTPAQQTAIREIKTSEDPVFLLFGVTGSGKTEVYLRLAEDMLSQGKQVLFLVPEIGLTPQMIQRVTNRFGSNLAVYHSGLSDQEKYEQYRKVKLKKTAIVVGTRSAVFLPFTNLGLIVMDEEQDASYKQEVQPCYHCRDAAIWRGQYAHCKVVLGSATPALESYARALKKVYHLVNLPERINGTLPAYTIVDMKKEMKQGGSYILSRTLIGKMQTCLDRKEQIILLLNKRGYHTQLRCRACKEVLLCPHCDLAMSYHADVKRLKCHTCGTERRVPRVCPYCGSTEGFTTYGYGTQRLEEEVRKLFPAARILRMDADTTSRKNGHARILNAFGNGEADILLGTQMIAKGLDYPRVTLVGILNGDEGLRRSDYRSCEVTFDLLMQAGGRSGRSDHPGEVVAQVFEPDAYAVCCAQKQDYRGFFAQEMQFRHVGEYPPYTYLIALVIQAKEQEKADETARQILPHLQGNFKVMGIAPLAKIRDYARDRIILKGKNLAAMRMAVRDVLADESIDISGLRIDVNPLNLV